MNDIGPWEWCPDDDGDGLRVCVDPQEGLANRWYFVNADLSGAILPAPGHAFTPGISRPPTLWRGVTLRYGREVDVLGIVDESKADPMVYGAVFGIPDDYGIAVELH